MFHPTRRIAIFIDGGFFLKRLPRLGLPAQYHATPETVAKTAYELCKRHVLRLVGNDFREDGQWLQFAYRSFTTMHGPMTRLPTIL